MEFALPPVGEGLYEVDLIRWLVKPGDVVRPGQSLVEVMSDKATMEVPAPFGGTILSTDASAGNKIKVGQLLLKYDGVVASMPSAAERMPAPTVKTAMPAKSAAEPGPPPVNAHVAAAPSVRHLARKLGIDLSRVRGSGPGGRILIEDLTPLLNKPASPTGPAGKAHGTDVSKLDFGVAGSRVKLAGLRKKIAERMVQSKRTIPHYSYMDEFDSSELVRIRTQLRDPLLKAGIKLTYLAFFVKAVTKALKEVPVVNSTFDEESQEIIMHDRYHIGLAVAAPTGLIVPVIKDADRRDIYSVANEIERLGHDAKNGKSKLEDLRGGTFTITSVGGIGGLISTPIINFPEVGILGVGKVVKRPVYDDHGNLRPADIIFLSFSFDHRIVDGAVGAAFSNVVLKHLSNPALLLLPEKY
jgi:2-oxoisovalerate dehydrogenase E2 component (dihydrolipoyl transacylase)